MATWRESLRDLLQTFPTGEITLAQIYTAAAPLAGAHPDNKSVEATIRRELQNIRDEGRLTFLGKGHYVLKTLQSPGVASLATDSATAPKKAEPGVPDTVPLEELGESTYAITPGQSFFAIKKERLLVANFETYLHGLNQATKRWKIPTVSNGILFTDPFNVSSGILYEAKAASTRESIRMAIGQLFDYRRYLQDEIAGVAVLVPDRPSDDMLELLLDLGIGCTYREDSGFVEAVSPGPVVAD